MSASSSNGFAAQTLEQHLTDCMAGTNLTIGRGGPAVDALREALAGDRLMATAAADRVAADVPMEPRDHITRWRSALLRALLGLQSQ